MSKKIAKKVTAKKTKKVLSVNKIKKNLKRDLEKKDQTVRVAKSKSVNHLFSRDERLDQDLFLIADIGKEVVISSDEVEFINKAFEDFKKAQEILKKYA